MFRFPDTDRRLSVSQYRKSQFDNPIESYRSFHEHIKLHPGLSSLRSLQSDHGHFPGYSWSKPDHANHQFRSVTKLIADNAQRGPTCYLVSAYGLCGGNILLGQQHIGPIYLGFVQFSWNGTNGRLVTHLIAFIRSIKSMLYFLLSSS